MSSKKLNRKDKKPIYQQIQDLIVGKINDGTWQPGAQIDSAPGLAKQLGVSIATVCRAIEALVARGTLVTRFGSGTYVADTALERQILWVNGLDMTSGGLSAYYVHCFETGRKIFARYQIQTESMWMGRTEDPLVHPALSRGEVLRRYNGVVLLACHPEHPIRSLLARYDIDTIDLFHRTPNQAGRQVRAMSNKLLRSWQGVSGPVVCISRVLKYIGSHAHCRYVIPPEINGVNANENWGFDTTWQLLENGDEPTHMLVVDDVIARGVTRAILAHRLHRGEMDKPWPKVVITGHEQVATRHGFPVDYIFTDVTSTLESIILPFIGKIIGKPIKTNLPKKLARYVTAEELET